MEEILDRLPNDSVHRGYDPRVPTALHRLQLPEGVRLVDRSACDYVLLPIQRILPAKLPTEEEASRKRYEKGSSAEPSSQWRDERYKQ